MRSAMVVGLIVMLGTINCGFWKKVGRDVIIRPDNYEVRINFENDIKNKTLRLSVDIYSLEQTGLITFYSHQTSKEGIVYIVNFSKSLDKPWISEVCILNGTTIMNNVEDERKYLNIVQRKKTLSGQDRSGRLLYMYSVELERQYGVSGVKCGELNIPGNKRTYNDGLSTFIPYTKTTAAKKYSLTYNFQSGNMVRLGLMIIVVLIGLYLL